MPLHRWMARLATFAVALGAALPVCAAEHAEEAHEYSIRGDLPFWTLVTFVGFLFVLKLLGWDALVGSLKQREEREAQLLADADASYQSAQNTLRTHQGRMEAVDEEIRELIAEAHRDAERTRTAILAAAEGEAETLRWRTATAIERTRDQALDEIFETLAQRVTESVEQRVTAGLSAADHDRLVEESLGQFAATST